MITNKNIPIVRRTLLSDGSYLTNIIGATTGSNKKLDFPYNIPVIETSNAIDKKTLDQLQTTLTTFASIFAIGLIGSAIIRRSKS